MAQLDEIAPRETTCHARRMSGGPKRLVRRLASKGRRLFSSAVEETHKGVPSVQFVGLSRTDVEPGTTLLEAARSLDIDLDHFCGGCCSCGTCRVEVLVGGGFLSRPQPDESLVLGPNALDAGDRLACQSRIHGPVEVRIPAFFGVRDE